MKAVICPHYGSPDVLQLKEIDKPRPMDDEVLINVHSSSINSWDWDLLTGKPLVYRLLFGILKPKFKILGADVAGRIEGVGKNVKKFKIGDEVFGDLSGCNWGGFAEYVCAGENALARKSNHMSFVQAAALPQAGVLALQGLQVKGGLHKGQKILINGAGGGVGMIAIQIAKSFGAEVTGVDRKDKLDALLFLGADHVIDYTKDDFTRSGIQYDLILDVMAHRSIFDYKRALCLDGIYVIIGGSLTRMLQLVLLRPWVPLKKKKVVVLVHKPNPNDLDRLNEFFESGKLEPVIDRCYPLSETQEAMRHFGRGQAKGKVVITI